MNVRQDDWLLSMENQIALRRGLSDNDDYAVDISALRNLEQAQEEGEPDLIVEVIDLYLEQAPRQLIAMAAQLSQGDAVSLRRTAHSLKGSSATLGAMHTAAVCEAIE